MNKILLSFLLILSACATDRPAEDTEGASSGEATIYGQLSVSVDAISTGR